MQNFVNGYYHGYRKLPDILFMDEAHFTCDGINTTHGIFTVADSKFT